MCFFYRYGLIWPHFLAFEFQTCVRTLSVSLLSFVRSTWPKKINPIFHYGMRYLYHFGTHVNFLTEFLCSSVGPKTGSKIFLSRSLASKSYLSSSAFRTRIEPLSGSVIFICIYYIFCCLKIQELALLLLSKEISIQNKYNITIDLYNKYLFSLLI